MVITPELGTLEWLISGLMLNPLFLLISRLYFHEIKYLDQQIGFQECQIGSFS